jgi:hypothetical protein
MELTMVSAISKRLARVTLRVYVGETEYRTIHVGAFPPQLVAGVASGLDARSLAYYSRIPGQIGRADIAVARAQGQRCEEERVEWQHYYEPATVEHHENTRVSPVSAARVDSPSVRI